MTNNINVMGKDIMEEIKENKKLYYNGGMSQKDFFQRIDEYGGWPIDKKYLSVEHTVEINRQCVFGNEKLRTGWWTTIYNIDDYLWWKMSPEGKKRYIKEANESLRDKLRNFIRDNF